MLTVLLAVVLQNAQQPATAAGATGPSPAARAALDRALRLPRREPGRRAAPAAGRRRARRLSADPQRRPLEGLSPARRPPRAGGRSGRMVLVRRLSCLRPDPVGPGTVVRGDRRPGVSREGRSPAGGVGQVHRAGRLLLLLAEAECPALHLRQDGRRPDRHGPPLRQQAGGRVAGEDHRPGPSRTSIGPMPMPSAAPSGIP